MADTLQNIWTQEKYWHIRNCLKIQRFLYIKCIGSYLQDNYTAVKLSAAAVVFAWRTFQSG